MRYRYRVVRSNKDPRDIKLAVRVPVIPVSLTYGETRRTVAALVDSGADCCLFHESIGRALGIDLESGRQELFRSLGPNIIPAFIHKVGLGLRGESNIEIEVAFLKADFLADGGLLGQHGFFDEFEVRFRRWEDAIYIERKKGWAKR